MPLPESIQISFQGEEKLRTEKDQPRYFPTRRILSDQSFGLSGSFGTVAGTAIAFGLMQSGFMTTDPRPREGYIQLDVMSFVRIVIAHVMVKFKIEVHVFSPKAWDVFRDVAINVCKTLLCNENKEIHQMGFNRLLAISLKSINILDYFPRFRVEFIDTVIIKEDCTRLYYYYKKWDQMPIAANLQRHIDKILDEKVLTLTVLELYRDIEPTLQDINSLIRLNRFDLTPLIVRYLQGTIQEDKNKNQYFIAAVVGSTIAAHMSSVISNFATVSRTPMEGGSYTSQNLADIVARLSQRIANMVSLVFSLNSDITFYIDNVSVKIALYFLINNNQLLKKTTKDKLTLAALKNLALQKYFSKTNSLTITTNNQPMNLQRPMWLVFMDGGQNVDYICEALEKVISVKDIVGNIKQLLQQLDPDFRISDVSTLMTKLAITELPEDLISFCIRPVFNSLTALFPPTRMALTFNSTNNAASDHVLDPWGNQKPWKPPPETLVAKETDIFAASELPDVSLTLIPGKAEGDASTNADLISALSDKSEPSPTLISSQTVPISPLNITRDSITNFSSSSNFTLLFQKGKEFKMATQKNEIGKVGDGTLPNPAEWFTRDEMPGVRQDEENLVLLATFGAIVGAHSATLISGLGEVTRNYENTYLDMTSVDIYPVIGKVIQKVIIKLLSIVPMSLKNSFNMINAAFKTVKMLLNIHEIDSAMSLTDLQKWYISISLKTYSLLQFFPELSHANLEIAPASQHIYVLKLWVRLGINTNMELHMQNRIDKLVKDGFLDVVNNIMELLKPKIPGLSIFTFSKVQEYFNSKALIIPPEVMKYIYEPPTSDQVADVLPVNVHKLTPSIICPGHYMCLDSECSDFGCPKYSCPTNETWCYLENDFQCPGNINCPITFPINGTTLTCPYSPDCPATSIKCPGAPECPDEFTICPGSSRCPLSIKCPGPACPNKFLKENQIILPCPLHPLCNMALPDNFIMCRNEWNCSISRPRTSWSEDIVNAIHDAGNKIATVMDQKQTIVNIENKALVNYGAKPGGEALATAASNVSMNHGNSKASSMAQASQISKEPVLPWRGSQAHRP